MAGIIERYPELTEICDQVLGVVGVSFRVGMEVGLRRMALLGSVCHINADLLNKAIREMDKEFDFVCPCTRFKYDLCERCGKPDTLGLRKIDEEA